MYLDELSRGELSRDKFSKKTGCPWGKLSRNKMTGRVRVVQGLNICGANCQWSRFTFERVKLTWDELP